MKNHMDDDPNGDFIVKGGFISLMDSTAHLLA